MKKKRYQFLLTAALLVSTAAGTLSSRAAVGTVIYTANYDGTPVIGTDTLGGVTYSTVAYGDLINGGQPGMPFLPIDYIRFSVPYNATNFTVSTTVRTNSTHYLDHLVYPSQAPRFMCDTTPVIINLPDTAAYFSGSSYPSQMAWVVDEGFLDGENHIVTVALLPFTYTHTSTTDKVYQRRRVNLQLHYTLSDSLAMYPIVRNDSLLREEGYRLAQSMVVNPNQVKAFAPQSPTSAGIESLGYVNGGIGGDGLNGGIPPINPPVDPPTPVDTTQIGMEEWLTGNEQYYPYLIVTTPELKNSVRRIAALKRQKGYNVKVVTMDEVMNDSYAKNGDYVNGHFAFTDSAGKLRQYLRHAYKYSNTRFVLLAGHGVPYRTFDYTSLHHIDSDLYFSDLTADWCTSHYMDSTFVFRIDKYPELFVGRILAYDSEEIMNYTDKLFRYELNPGNGDYNYLKKIFYSVGLDFVHDNHDEWNPVNDEYSSVFSSYTRFLEEKDSYFPSGTDIVNELNSTRYGYISIMHHAAPSGYVTYGQRNQDHDTSGITYYYLWAIDSIKKTNKPDAHVGNGFNNLTNKWYPNVCYSVGCTTMPFNNSDFIEDLRINCGESFTTGKDYGGPAFLGNTNEGMTNNFSTKLESYFAKQLQSSKGHYKVGLAEAFSKDDFYHDPSSNTPVILTHNLLGDPEFEIWTDIPQEFSNIEIKRDDHSITIKGIDADSCIVGYRSNSGFPEFHKVHSDSTVLNNVSPNGMIMLYTHNYIPYIASLELQNETINTSKYVIASDVTAGYSIDSGRTNGNVILKNGSGYEIEASGTVRLEDGFIVEKGATFAVYPSSF